MEVIWGNKDRASTNISAVSHTSLPPPARSGPAAGLTRRSTSLSSMPRSGRMRRRRTWSMSPYSATATTRTPPALAILTTSGSNSGDAPQLGEPPAPTVWGKVKWYNAVKRYGFVELSYGSADAFLHASALASISVDALQPGVTIEFRTAPAQESQGLVLNRGHGASSP